MADEERQEEQTTQETEPEQSRAEDSQPEPQPEPKSEPPPQREPEEDTGKNKEPERSQKAEKTPETVKTPEPENPQEPEKGKRPEKSKAPEKKPQRHQPQQKPTTAPVHPQQHHASRTVSKDKSEYSDGRGKQREFFKEELRRLEGGLKKESSKIVPPSRRRYTPFIYNSLEPYYNTHTTRFVIEMPEEQFQSYSSRNTALGLCDPWIDLRMDHELLPQISARPYPRHDTAGHSSKRGSHKEKKGDGPNRKEGSTRLPKFPVVSLETKELATKQLYYSDVPMLRKELKTKYSSQSKQKVDQDYKRTQQDFYRMDLDRLDQVAPTNRRHLTSTYMAYLQNTPGSRRAVTECVQRLEGKAN